MLRGARRLLPKILGVGKKALQTTAKGITKAAKSETGRALGRNLKDIAISTAADAAASAISGNDPLMALQQGIEDAKVEISDTLKKKASEYKPYKKRKVGTENDEIGNKSKRKRKKNKSNRPYNLFEQY